MPETISRFQGPHPLVETVGLASVRGVATIRLRTDFVDVTPFFSAYSEIPNSALTPPDCTVVVLGHTGEMPKIWIALLPKACATSTTANVSAMVFFRPASYGYSAIAQKHTATAIPRYFLSPMPDADASAQFWERDHCFPQTDARGNQYAYNLMRCGFGAALVNSFRAVVVLNPWPSGDQFGVAASAQLPSLTTSAIRFLWAAGHLCEGVANVHLGRLGLSSFSRGGLAMWPTLAANRSRVSEVWAFDTMDAADASALAVQWYRADNTRSLRLVGGAYHRAQYRAIQQTLQNYRASMSQFSAVLVDPNDFDPSYNPAWQHYTKDVASFPPKNWLADTQHQFAICGGTRIGDRVTPYFEKFMLDSGFNFF
ncbi:hypothetical protein LZC95_49195 [Pendulispora brunnea]|uniref:Uncharacterized protein n=1 Tax=Pendulispora brunnea TaxID=2905690 RepID=A0ABZ2K6U6_9BACT